ncbi:vWA domain-containing protein [Sediminitomix flava]|uniref:Ca-activated chloride channel family protein n=1 Tax=Sediminitomix flava TaxID=379075 RepID=A0A315Z4I3_SEDFL|nr:VWA domain-containing protein [Sediminitomix flava]PWJ37999.1 Ca-activated chloride channel family protein [Sediminitomix flava]
MKNKLLSIFSLLFFISSISLSLAQEITVAGTVTDENQDPLPGVNIQVKGTSMGTVSNFDGKYSIKAKPSDILVFEYIGYKSQEIKIEGKRLIDVQLQPDTEQLDEVVVSGYGRKKVFGFKPRKKKGKNNQSVVSVPAIVEVPDETQIEEIEISVPEYDEEISPEEYSQEGIYYEVSEEEGAYSIIEQKVSGLEVKKSLGFKPNKKKPNQLPKKQKPEDLPEEEDPQTNPNEEYAFVEENPFKTVTAHPLSTFSVDVDAASYSNVRRYLNNGTLPPRASVRLEEMINYFDYSYPQPEGDVPFSINSELSICPWDQDNLLLHIGLQGKQIDHKDLPPSNIVFLLDVSGSMSDSNKLPLLKSSLKLLLETLRPEDRVAIVVYAGSSGIVLPSTPCNEKDRIIEALEDLRASGASAGGEGLQLAYKVANDNFIEGGNNRIVMATDGDFNVGQSSNAELEQIVVREREKGIAISVLGFGMGNYKDAKMEIIANKGNGNFSYIDNFLEAQKVLVKEFGGTLFTIAKDVKFQLEFNPIMVAEYRLIGYENRALANKDFNDDTKDAGEIGVGHNVTALYEIVPASGMESNTNLKYQKSAPTVAALESNDLITLKLRYKQPEGTKSQLVEKVVKNTPIPFEVSSNNFRFSAAVAQFGMLLKNSKYRGNATWDSTKELAKGAKGRDDEGYRAEMVRLIENARILSKSFRKKASEL